MNGNKKRKRGGAVGAWALIALTAALVLLFSALAPGGADGRFSAKVTAQSAVRISGIVAANTSALMLADGTLPDWIELENNGDSEVSLAGYALMCNDDPTDVYRIRNAAIPADGRILIYADGGSDSGDELHAPFKLSASGETVVLMNAAGAVIDSVHTPELHDDEAYCRDASGEWTVRAASAPGRENAVTAAAMLNASERSVVVTEVMSANASYCPDENGEYHDYVELTNTSDEAVSLKDWYLSDNRSDLAMWQFPDVTLPAGGTMVVYCSGYDRREDVGRLHTNFRLGSDGTDVVLTRNDGRTAGLIEVPALETDQAYSLVDGEWTKNHAPTPGMENTWENTVRACESIRERNSENVLISEIAASTTQMNGTEWIELYNAGHEAVDLSGYGLTDNAARPRKWQFPAGTVIRPGEYLGVLCSGLDGVVNGQYHTSFKLSVDGGYTVALSRPDGMIIDRTYVPQQYEDVTYGRVEGSNGFYYFTLPTPLAKNDATPYLGRAEQPRYSVEGGLYSTGEVLTVEMTSAPGMRIYYTLDNTDPTEASARYTGPITVTGTTVLRTRVYGENYLPSFMDAQSYLYDVNCAGSDYVVSLVSDPANLYGQESGIIANSMEEWEREAHVELFGENGKCVISQECGISLHGQSSRVLPVKCFNVIARTRYGANRFEYPIFSEHDYPEYQAFLLRASGEDYDKSFMRDTVLSSLMEDSSVMYQKYEIGVVYLNGEYYTLCYLRERVNKYSICQFEDWLGQEDEIDIVRANTTVVQGSNDSFERLRSWLKENDPSTEAAYALLDSQIDIRNYIEYMAIQIFSGNTDTLNVRRYRNAGDDGKWRWVLFDLDWAFYQDTDSIRRWLTPGGTGASNRTDNTFFIACMKNPRFRDEFLTYLGEKMASEFTSEYIVGRFAERYQRIEPLLPEYQLKWGVDLFDGLKKIVNYAQKRPTKLLGYLRNALSLSDAEMQKYFGEAIEIIQQSAA